MADSEKEKYLPEIMLTDEDVGMNEGFGLMDFFSKLLVFGGMLMIGAGGIFFCLIYSTL